MPSFRIADAFIRIRVNSYPMAAALDRAQYQVNRFAARFGRFNLTPKLGGLKAMGGVIDGITAKTLKYAAVVDKFGRAGKKFQRFWKEFKNPGDFGTAGKFIDRSFRFQRKAMRFGRDQKRAGIKQVREGILNPLSQRILKKHLPFRKVMAITRFGTRMAGRVGKNLIDAGSTLNRHGVGWAGYLASQSGQFLKSNRGVIGAALARPFAKVAGALNVGGLGKAIDAINLKIGHSRAMFGAWAERNKVAIASLAQPFKFLGMTFEKTMSGIFNLGAGLISVINPFKLLGSLVEGVIGGMTSLLSVGLNVAGMLARIGLVSAIGVAAGIMLSVKAAGDEEAQLVNLGRVADITGESLTKLKRSLLDIAAASHGASLKEINDIATFGARMGIGNGLDDAAKGAALTKFTADLSKLKLALDDIPVEEAATKITRILRVFGEGEDKILNFSSVLVGLDNASTATASEILELTRRMSGIASVMGMSSRETAAFGAAMRDIGLEVHVGGTAMQQLFLKMGAETDHFSKVLGLNRKEMEKKIDTAPLEAVAMVLGRMKQFSPRQQMKFLTQLHMQGRQTASTILQLSQGFSSVAKFIAIANGEWTSLNAVEQAAELRSKTLWAMLQNLWNKVNVLAEAIGSQLLPVFKELAKLFGDVATLMTDGVRGMDTAIKPVVDAIVDAIQNVRAALRDLPTTMAIVSSWFHDKLEAIGDWFSHLGADIMSVMGKAMKAIGQFLLDVYPHIKSISIDLGFAIGDAIMQGIRATLKGTIFESYFEKASDRTQKQIDARKNALKSMIVPGPGGLFIPGVIGSARARTPQEYQDALKSDPQLRSLQATHAQQLQAEATPRPSATAAVGGIADMVGNFFKPPTWMQQIGLGARKIVRGAMGFKRVAQIQGMRTKFDAAEGFAGLGGGIGKLAQGQIPMAGGLLNHVIPGFGIADRMNLKRTPNAHIRENDRLLQRSRDMKFKRLHPDKKEKDVAGSLDGVGAAVGLFAPAAGNLIKRFEPALGKVIKRFTKPVGKRDKSDLNLSDWVKWEADKKMKEKFKGGDFHGLEEFNKKIQGDLFDPERNYQKMANDILREIHNKLVKNGEGQATEIQRLTEIKTAVEAGMVGRMGP